MTALFAKSTMDIGCFMPRFPVSVVTTRLLNDGRQNRAATAAVGPDGAALRRLDRVFRTGPVRRGPRVDRGPGHRRCAGSRHWYRPESAVLSAWSADHRHRAEPGDARIRPPARL